jgi:integrase/recombinase XerD
MLNKLRLKMRPVTLSRGLAIVANLRRPTENTIHWYEEGIGSLVEYIGEDVTAAGVTPDTIAGWYAWLQRQDNKHEPGQRLSQYTVNRRARSVRAVFNHLERAGHIERSPVQIVIPNPPRKRKKSIAPEDIEALVRHAHTLRDQAIVLTLRDSGCRLNALASMTVARLTFYEIEGRREARAVVYDDKIDEWLTITIQDRAARALERYLLSRPETASDAVWLTHEGKPMLANGFRQALHRIGVRAGVQRTNPHAFRHAKVQRMLQNGAPHKVIQDTLGWKSDAMIQEYVQSDAEDLARYNRTWDNFDSE